MLARLCTTEQTSGETAPVAVGITNNGRPAGSDSHAFLVTGNHECGNNRFLVSCQVLQPCRLRKTHLQLLYRYPR